MTKEGIINGLKNIFSYYELDLPHTDSLEIMLTAIEALDKVEKYKWHDLRKDPKDLPEFNEGVVWLILDGIDGNTHYHMSPAEGYWLATDQMLADTKEKNDIVVALAEPMHFPEMM